LFIERFQRYYSNFAYVSSKTNFKYVFLLIQGEGPLHHKMIYDESQPIVGWAKQFGAALFALEHRFYGESQPTPDQSVKNLKYLNSRQALGDIAEFIIGINKGYGLRDPVWITFGGSYAGEFSDYNSLNVQPLLYGLWDLYLYGLARNTRI
ncbi:hypothetical protein OESDEN_17846, partial [Oesophagostomum dentatum]